MIDPHGPYNDLDKSDKIAKEIISLLIANKLSYYECRETLHRAEFVLEEFTSPGNLQRE